MRAGNIDAMVVQDPFRMGYLGVKVLVEYVGGRSPEKRIETGATLLTAAMLKDSAIRKLLLTPTDKYPQ
jgi:ribose transport system substrate-binding protein